MKKIITSLLTIAILLAVSFPADAQVAGCSNSMNVVTNGDFAGAGGFTSGIPFGAFCGANSWMLGNNFNVKCATWPNVTGNGQFMIVDGPPAGGPVNVWNQSVPICPNTNYTFSFSAYSLYTSPFTLNFIINGATIAGPASIAVSAWTTYSIVWNSGALPSGMYPISLQLSSGGAQRDFGLDDIFFGYCGTTTVTSPTSICSGNCTTLTANAPGATSYSWSPGGGSGSSIVVCPGSTTSYTVTPAGCLTYVPATTTVTVNPSPTVTATATPSMLTPPSATTSFLSTTVSGGSGYTYSWAPATGLSSTTVANPVATPSTTTVYTVTVTNSSGCSSTATTTVTVTPQSLCTLTYDYDITSSTTTSSFFGSLTGVSNANLRINGVLTVDGSFNFSACNIQMEPGSRIETATGSGAVLYITGGTHIYSCEGMWDGIYVQNGTSIQVKNKAAIEDALKAVKIDQGATGQVEFCVFNRNYTAVELTANTSATSPLSMFGCVVTSRDIPFFASVASNPTASAVWGNIVAGVYPSISMKTPYYGYKSIYGVYATDVNFLQVGTDADPTWYNGFDNMASTGIFLVRSNTVIYNNNFRTITNSPNCLTCTALIGVGIYATGSTTGSYALKVGGLAANQPNTFTDIYSSVEAVNYQTMRVLENTITNSSTTTALYGGYGKSGIKITPRSSHMIDIRFNGVTNCATAIWLNRVSAGSMPIAAQMVDDNTVTANSSGFTTNGIYVTDYSGGGAGSPSPSEINYNTIIEAVNCINMTYVQTKLDVMSNSCLTRYAIGGTTSGIRAVNTQFVTFRLNHTKYTSTAAGLPGGNILSYGIFLQNSPNNYIFCNTIEDAARSLAFDGNCSSPSNIFQNTMRRAQDGLVLLTATSEIGTQGGPGAPSNNYWDMNFYFTNQVVNNNTTTPLVLWVNAGTGGATATEPTSFAGAGTVTVITTGGSPTPCGSVPPRMHAPVESVAPTTLFLSVYPSPNNGTFTVETNSTEAKDLFVYDATGRLVYSLTQITDNSIAVDIASEAKGLYLVKVVSGGETRTARVMNQ